MKKLIYTLLIIIALTNNLFAAGSSSDSDSTPKASDYTKAKNLINSAKKYEKKGKIDKAQERYAKAQKLLLNEKPLQADTLNYLGFTTRKLGDFEGGEKFYLQGLEIEPNHNGINEYLGELYVVTNRIDMAKERLEVLKNCNCEEYEELKEIIDGSKKSKY